MKSTISILAVALASTASVLADSPSRVVRSSPSLVQRDVAAASSIINEANEDIATLDKAINGFNGKNGPQLQETADEVLASIKETNNKVGELDDLTIEDAMALEDVSIKISTSGEKLLADLDAKVDAFASAGICSPVLKSVTDIGNEVNSVLENVASKFPKEAQEIAQSVVDVTKQAFASSEKKLKACAATTPTGSAAPTPTAPVEAGAGALVAPVTGLLAALAAFIL